MKTFQEALDTVILTAPVSAPQEQVTELMQRIVDRMKRTQSLCDEAAEHERLAFVLAATAEACCCRKHAMLNAFTMGLQVGMEMEKSETGGVAQS